MWVVGRGGGGAGEVCRICAMRMAVICLSSWTVMPVFKDDGGAPLLLLVLRPLGRPPALLLRVPCCWGATIIFLSPGPFALALGSVVALGALVVCVRGRFLACLVLSDPVVEHGRTKTRRGASLFQCF